MVRIRETLVVTIVVGLLLAYNTRAQGASLVSQGQPKAVIVSGTGQLNQFAASEVQRYIEAFTGAKLEIVTPEEARRRPSSVAWVLVGGPQANELVRAAASRKLADFDKLKTDGFLLRTVQLEGRPALVVGGNDDASTMYAVYDLMERYGATFLLTGDILPEKKADLELRNLNVRSEPAFSRRGFLVSFIYPNRSVMSLPEEKQFIDQMAKMKMNYLVIFQFPYEPWVKYDYHGEVKWMGDIATKESGYDQWTRDFGPNTTTGIIGEDHFKAAGVYPRLAPPEFQHVENNEDAFVAAKKYLQETIAYAVSRKIKVWMAIDATSAVPNLARYTTRTLTLPFHPIFGTFICPNNPVSWELNEMQLKGLMDSYPQAEGYFLSLAEAYPVCNVTQKDRNFYFNLRSLYPGEALARSAFTGDIVQDNDTLLDSNSGSVFLIQKLMESRDRIAPNAKLGVLGLGRLYMAPYVDKLFPKNVPFTDMESSAIWTPSGVPMQMFGGMGERENTLMNRIDDDSDMLGMQFNVNLYYRDQVLEGGLKYGLAGFDSQMNRARGTEPNTKYMAEGEWNPHLTPDDFYRDYATRIFGEEAGPKMLDAFRVLEKNEELLGWTGGGNFGCCGPPKELDIAHEYSKQPNLFDGPRIRSWQPFINQARDGVATFSGSIKMLHEALADMESAKSLAAPRSQPYLAFLINRTEAYILHLETVIAWQQAYIDFDSAFQLKGQGAGQAEFVKQLDASLTSFQTAHAKAVATAEKWSELVDHPSDLGVLYRIDTFMVTGTQLTVDLMQNVDNFYHGRDYVKPVDFNKVYVTWPLLAETPWQAPEFTPAQ